MEPLVRDIFNAVLQPSYARLVEYFTLPKLTIDTARNHHHPTPMPVWIKEIPTNDVVLDDKLQKLIGKYPFYQRESLLLWLPVVSSFLKVLRNLPKQEDKRTPFDNFDVDNSVMKNEWKGACVSSLALFSAYLKLFVEGDRSYLPLLYRLAHHAFFLAKMADQSAFDASAFKFTKELAMLINKAFTFCINDRSQSFEASRRWGTYHLANRLLQLYIKLGQDNLSKNILRAIAVAELPDFECLPKADQVAHKYFLGLLYFKDSKFQLAERELEFAYLHCHHAAERQLRSILHLLIPSKLLSLKAPSPDLLQKYGLNILYGPIIAALKTGNWRLYDECMQKNFSMLAKLGTLLAFQRLRIYVFRQLFKKMYLLMDKPTRISLSHLMVPFALMQEPMDLITIQELLVNLIDKGFVKGYLSEEKSMLVLSHLNPFPLLN